MSSILVVLPRTLGRALKCSSSLMAILVILALLPVRQIHSEGITQIFLEFSRPSINDLRQIYNQSLTLIGIVISLLRNAQTRTR